MSWPLIFLAIDVATIVCAALVCGRVLISRPQLRSAQLIGLIAFGTACGVLLGHQDYDYWTPQAFRIDVGGWAWALILARNITPGLFMILCFTLFTDRRRFPKGLLALFALQLALEEPGRAVIPSSWRYAWLLTQTAPALLQTLFAAFALYWTVADWHIDLIERRRRARVLTLVGIGVLTLVSGLLTRVLIDPDSPANYAAHVGLTLADLAILIVVLFQLADGDIGRSLAFEAVAVAQPRRSVEADASVPLTRLTMLLQIEQVWQEERLSLGALARRVGLPEYRLRKLIHEELGYRNFNALLHHYRVREACRQLGDPGLRRTPILTIALSVGYASVNTFNRGFRKIMGVTPSEWRATALADNTDTASDRQ